MNENDDAIAPCGIDCIHCEFFHTSGQVALWERVASQLGTTAEKVACLGCRKQGGCSVHRDCATLACVTEKGLDSCGDCAEFPCRKLQPLAARADKVPHNLKVYNLCRIRQVGKDAFLAESRENRRLYFEGRFVIGAGPQ
jgi:hypothetical protein